MTNREKLFEVFGREWMRVLADDEEQFNQSMAWLGDQYHPPEETDAEQGVSVMEITEGVKALIVGGHAVVIIG